MEKVEFYEAAAKANAVSLSEKGAAAWASVGMAITSIYLFALAAGLVFACLRIRSIWPVANEPGILMRDEAKDWSLEEMREAELRSQQRCIERNRARNDRVGMWLIRVRIGATASATGVYRGCGFCDLSLGSRSRREGGGSGCSLALQAA